MAQELSEFQKENDMNSTDRTDSTGDLVTLTKFSSRRLSDRTWSKIQWISTFTVLLLLLIVTIACFVFIKQEQAENEKRNDLLMLEMTKLHTQLKEMDAYEQDIDTSRPYCGNVSQSEAEIWYGNGGVFTFNVSSKLIRVYCDLTTDGGGWTVFQRRMNGSIDFQKNWNSYVNGFGDASGEFWLGLENMYQIMSQGGRYELRVDLTDWDSDTAYAMYRNFVLEGVEYGYRLNVDMYSGTAGDSLSYHNRMKFTTVDHDNDISSNNCAQLHSGGWWYHQCDTANLNGEYKPMAYYRNATRYDDGIEWKSWKDDGYYSMKFTEMKFRKR